MVQHMRKYQILQWLSMVQTTLMTKQMDKSILMEQHSIIPSIKQLIGIIVILLTWLMVPHRTGQIGIPLTLPMEQWTMEPFGIWQILPILGIIHRTDLKSLTEQTIPK